MQESNTVVNANKFTPQPGDKIICNNGEEFICCTLEALVSEGFNPYFKKKSDSIVFGTKGDYSGWMYWHNGGYTNDPEWNIREVIPQSSEVTAHKKEEVKEEPRYTVEEVLAALEIVSNFKFQPYDYENEVAEYLNKIKSPEYQEDLRLKAIYD